MLSQLIFRSANLDLAAFQHAHPHDWLLWEAGRWKPPASSTVMLGDLSAPQSPQPTNKSADSALAVALIPNATGSFTLGRGNECDAPINDGTLSQLHLVFMRDSKGEWTVRDAGSKNGSWLDGRKLESGKPHPLRDGTRIVAAQVAFTYYTPGGMLARLKQP
jgi:pSer/pThr/pTyr-binding forkhead associated (FHA) protein